MKIINVTIHILSKLLTPLTTIVTLTQVHHKWHLIPAHYHLWMHPSWSLQIKIIFSTIHTYSFIHISTLMTLTEAHHKWRLIPTHGHMWMHPTSVLLLKTINVNITIFRDIQTSIATLTTLITNTCKQKTKTHFNAVSYFSWKML